MNKGEWPAGSVTRPGAVDGEGGGEFGGEIVGLGPAAIEAKRMDRLVATAICALMSASCASVPRHGEPLGTALERAEREVSAGRFERAETLLEAGLEAARRADLPADEARFLLGLARLRDERGDSARALESARQAGAHASEIAAAPLEAESRLLAARAQRRLDRYDEAWSDAALALVMAERQELPALESAAQRELGAVLQARGDYDAALDRYDLSLEIARTAADEENESRTLNALGGWHRERAEYTTAIERYTGSLALRRALDDRPGEGRVLGNLCAAYYSLDNTDKALDYCREALKIARRIGDRAREANHLNALGGIERSTGRFDRAISLYRRSAQLKRALGDLVGEAHSINNIGEIYLQLGRYDAARRELDRSLAAKRALGDLPGVVSSLANLGLVAREEGRRAQARGLFREALAVEGSIGLPERRWRLLDGLASTYDDWPRVAIFYRKQAVGVIQAIRAEIATLDERQQARYLDGKVRVYEALAAALIAQGRLLEARQVLDMIKAQEHLHFVRGERVRSEVAVADDAFTAPALDEEEREWQRRWAEIDGRFVEILREHAALSKRDERSAAEQERLTELTGYLDAIDEELERLREELETALANPPAEGPTFSPADLDSLQGFGATLGELGERVVGLHFLPTADRLHILVTPGELSGPFHLEHDIGARALNDLILDFVLSIEAAATETREVGAQLYDALFGPIAADLERLDAELLVVSLQGALRYLPVAALYHRETEEYVVERYAVVLFNAAVGHRLIGSPAEQWEVAGLGVSEEHGDFPPLPGVLDELDGIIKEGDDDPQGVLPGRSLLNASFTDRELQELLSSKAYPVVHVATHFALKPGDERDSHLLLGDGSQLTLAEFKKRKYSLGDVDLLTLSACETAVSQGAGQGSGQGREVEGLGTIAQLKGAKAVMATLWKVADDSTSQLMQRFYALREGGGTADVPTGGDAGGARLTKAEALRRAQLGLLYGGEERGPGSAASARGLRPPGATPGEASAGTADTEPPYAHPYYWAPFVLMGDPR